MEQQLFQNFEVLHMSDLRERNVAKLSTQGIQNPLYRSENLKARILKAYPRRVSFWHPKYRSETELIYCNDVPKGQIVESAVNVSGEQNTSFEENKNTHDNYVYNAAKNARASLLNQEAVMPWPPYAANLSQENIFLPRSVYNLFAWILTDDNDFQPRYDSDEKVDLKDPFIKRLVQSFGQDLFYAFSKGKQKTPKHVALPLIVKNLTGSKEVIKLLNRYGQGISYNQVLQIETRLAEEQLKTEVNGVILPKIIQPNVFSTFCWDNIDIIEETLSGQGTTHCTNGIVSQRQVAGCEPPPVEVRNTCDGRARSSQAVLNQVPEFNAGRQCEPMLYALDIALTESTDSHHEALKDFAWFLSRTQNTLEAGLEQSIPAWSAFIAIANKQDIPPKTEVGYCQLIDASPTELSTFYTLLRKSVIMAMQLGLADNIVVLDQAIYAKALEVVWKEQFESVVLRMGSFHIACVFLAVVRKRSGESGLRHLLIESRIIGSGSVSGVLQGKHYNMALLTHKDGIRDGSSLSRLARV